MIMQSLHGLYDRLVKDDAYRLARYGFSLQKISFKVVLRPDGELFGIEDMRSVEGKRPRQVLVPGGSKPPGSGINPCFLWDNTAYLLGFKPVDDNPERSRASFEAFRDRHLALRNEVNCPQFSAVCRFLAEWNPDQASDHPLLEEITTGFGVFQILGETRFVHEDPSVETWWRKYLIQQETGPTGQCLITGQRGPIARLHDKVRGVYGSQSMGATIAGFNDPAYWSYGKQQSYNAPVSEDAAFRYVTALNALLDGPKRDRHRLLLGDSTLVFWTERESLMEDIFLPFFAAHDSGGRTTGSHTDENVRAKLEVFLKALRTGRLQHPELGSEESERTRFFLLALAPNAARLAVRFFHEGDVAELVEHLRRHYSDMRIERRFGEGTRRPDPEFPSIPQLLDETCPRRNGKPDREKIPPILAGPLLESVVVGAPYPAGLLAGVMRRIHVDASVNYVRASVVKGYLTRNRKQEVSVSLDITNTNPAYRLGRLFAALEKTQKDAYEGGLNRTIRDSFYSSASANPRMVFPRLLRLYQHHLAKLEGGRKVGREILVQEIMDRMSGFPAHLSLEEQGLFAIGYYHQNNDFYRKREPQEAPDEMEEEER